MNTYFKLCAVILLFSCFITFSYSAPNTKNKKPVLNSKEKIIQEEINYLKKQVNNFASKTKTLSNEIELLERKREIFLKEKKLTLNKKREIQKKIKELKAFVKETDKEISKKRNYLNRRILELYKKGEYMVLEMILFPESEESLIHSLNTFHYLNSKDKDEINSLATLMKENKAATIRMKSAENNLQAKLIKLTALQKEIRQTYKKRKKMFNSIVSKKKQYTKLLKERSSLLQDLITSIEKRKSTSSIPAISISRFKKLLSLPVPGRIIEKFGKIRNRKFGTYLKSNGITIKVRKRTKVLAFYDGTVVFADWYKSYGKLVIIDHKEGYFSFYAHLDSFSVKINQTVLKGDIIAKTGNTASLKGNILHFELWHKKKPLNPLKWIRKKRK